MPLLIEVIKNNIEIEFNSQDCRKVPINEIFEFVLAEELTTVTDQVNENSSALVGVDEQIQDVS